jgi:hypothetical protein
MDRRIDIVHGLFREFEGLDALLELRMLNQEKANDDVWERPAVDSYSYLRGVVETFAVVCAILDGKQNEYALDARHLAASAGPKFNEGEAHLDGMQPIRDVVEEFARELEERGVPVPELDQDHDYVWWSPQDRDACIDCGWSKEMHASKAELDYYLDNTIGCVKYNNPTLAHYEATTPPAEVIHWSAAKVRDAGPRMSPSAFEAMRQSAGLWRSFVPEERSIAGMIAVSMLAARLEELLKHDKPGEHPDTEDALRCAERVVGVLNNFRERGWNLPDIDHAGA